LTNLQRAQQGEPDAFAALFEQYKNLVFKTAYLMLGTRTDAEDALQEVFVRVHHSLREYDPRKGAFTTWLHRITLNHCLNQRRQWRFAFLSLDTFKKLPAPRASNLDLADEENIRQAIRALSDKQRAVIILRYYWDLPYGDIGEILNIPLGTVKSRLDLAHKTLRHALGTDEDAALASQVKVIP
jgi:RNA polymerase sigma-70 factor, ECF subfamily